MRAESFPFDDVEESYAIWFFDDFGRWSEARIFHHDDDTSDGTAKERCETTLQEFKERMHQREFKVLKLRTTHEFSII